MVDGHLICTLCIADAAPRDWGERELQTLENATAAIASRCGFAWPTTTRSASTSSSPPTTAFTS